MTALAIIATLTAVALTLTARRLKRERDAARIESAQRLMRNVVASQAFAEKEAALTRIAKAEILNAARLAERNRDLEAAALPILPAWDGSTPRRVPEHAEPLLYLAAGGAL